MYRATKAFPKDELFGLTSQLRRAAGSIGANVAEGCGRDGAPEFVRFLGIAAGSASELDHHLLLARDLHLLSDSGHKELSQELTELRRMLTSLIQRVRLKPITNN